MFYILLHKISVYSGWLYFTLWQSQGYREGSVSHNKEYEAHWLTISYQRTVVKCIWDHRPILLLSYFLTLERRIFLYFCLFLASLWNGITLFPWFSQLSFVYDDIKTQSLYSSDLSPTFTFMWSQFSPRASPYLVNISTWSSL